MAGGPKGMRGIAMTDDKAQWMRENGIETEYSSKHGFWMAWRGCVADSDYEDANGESEIETISRLCQKIGLKMWEKKIKWIPKKSCRF